MVLIIIAFVRGHLKYPGDVLISLSGAMACDRLADHATAPPPPRPAGVYARLIDIIGGDQEPQSV